MRLFVAVRPVPEVLDALDALPRPSTNSIRWTTRDQWHVTLRFLGNVDDPAPVTDALDEVARRAAPVDARIGPRAGVLGRQVVHLPVTGLCDLEAAVVGATRAFGEPPPTRPFRGHVTLGRTRARNIDTTPLALERGWTVRDIELIRSQLGRGGAHYETLGRFDLRA